MHQKVVCELPDTPALLVDLERLEANITHLFGQAQQMGVRVRPHLKTAKAPELARIMHAAGAQGFCAATLGEAEVFAEAGITDLLITREIAGATKLGRLTALHRRCPALRVVVDSAAGATMLAQAMANSPAPLDVLIELDVGQQRCGVAPGAAALGLAQAIGALPQLRLIGLQGYEGHLQHVADLSIRAEQVHAAIGQLTATADLLRGHGHAITVVTTGGTGTWPICAQHPGVTEVQPGSFIFLDAAYRDALGPDSAYRPALAVVATVISRPTPLRAVVDAGLKALSTDMGNAQPYDMPGVRYRPGGDEHGILEWDADTAPELAIGDQVALLPSHIDTTVNLHDTYHVQRGGELVARWPIVARGRCS